MLVRENLRMLRMARCNLDALRIAGRARRMSWLRKFFGGTSGGSEADAPQSRLPSGVDVFLPPGNPPLFRASATSVGSDPETRATIFRSGTGISPISREEAARLAQEKADRHLAAALQNRTSVDTYAYTTNRQLEPVLSEVEFPGGSAGRLTINSYGAVIVNARAVLFADVDTRAADEAPENLDADAAAAGRLRALVADKPELAFRVYRTRNGWRYLCTSRLFDPTSPETRELLDRLGVDARFILLCRVQRCFRARLTPKPWRIGDRFYSVRPGETVSRRELERHLAKGAAYAAAAFTSEIGPAVALSSELEAIVACHDDWCWAHSGKPLA